MVAMSGESCGTFDSDRRIPGSRPSPALVELLAQIESREVADVVEHLVVVVHRLQHPLLARLVEEELELQRLPIVRGDIVEVGEPIPQLLANDEGAAAVRAD